MIKYVLSTIIMDEKSIKKICQLNKMNVLFLFLMTNILFPIIFHILCKIFLGNYSLADYLFFAITDIKDTIVFNAVLFFILTLILYFENNSITYFDLTLKAVIAMNFINPLFCIMNYYLENLLVQIVFLIYDIIFITVFLRTNIEIKEISKTKLRLCVIFSFIILLLLYGFIYKIVMLQ